MRYIILIVLLLSLMACNNYSQETSIEPQIIQSTDTVKVNDKTNDALLYQMQQEDLNRIEQNNTLYIADTVKKTGFIPPVEPIEPIEPIISMGDQTRLDKLKTHYNLMDHALYIVIKADQQRLYLYQGTDIIAQYPISTSAYGLGSQAGSNKTPLGIHKVAQRFGDNAPLGMIFKARQPTGKIAEILTDPVDVKTDYVTTRILWLEGLESGKNKGSGIDSYKRYIYIHGTPEEGLIGQPASHGCIRMINQDVMSLFEQVPLYTLVVIEEN